MMGINPIEEVRMTQVADEPNGPKENVDFKKQPGAGYEIHVKDHLESYWFGWFEGWTITNLENAQVRLTCSNLDQSGLHGTLNKIRDLNLTLISVRRIEEETRE
jgi:hypothetical protein